MTSNLLTFIFSTILVTIVFAQDPEGFGDVSIEGSSEPLTTDTPNTRIVGGKIVTDSIVPFLANIHIYDKEELYSTCSGTVLGSQWILSAAHCFNFPGEEWDVNVARSYVTVGTVDVDPSDDDFFYNMEKVYVHKKYNPSSMGNHNDIAIIKLSTPITEGRYSVIEIGKEPAPGTEVIVAGYGAIDDRLTETEFGKQATMIAQSFETCSDVELPYWREYLKKDIMVCATSVGFPDKAETDICYGDSGGPLFVGEEDSIYQYGITSFSTTGCGAVGATPWFTRLSPYKESILDLVANENTKVYTAFTA